MNAKARLIAFHLPQFHPIPENNDWWGNGFTEWTNTAKAKPLFRGHIQPHLPADLGFYDLRLPEARAMQAELARTYGIEGFCYYHYWFGGKRLLERPFNDILASGEPDFPFCLCWANETWTGIWHGNPNRILIEQTYPGEIDHRTHFDFLLQAFRDRRYIRVEGKPLFLVYRPWEIPDVKNVVILWRSLSEKAGQGNLFLIAIKGANREWNPLQHGFDGTVTLRIPLKRPWVSWRTPIKKFTLKMREWRSLPTIYYYQDIVDQMLSDDTNGGKDFPCVVPNWDNTPRSGKHGLVLHGSTPELFRNHFRKALKLVEPLDKNKRFVFIKSWNEWAEGNYLEPDQQFGRQYLDVIKEEMDL